MKKDTHLINIYLKIHNKQNLTMDDLRYLAQYAPECFEKTCKNVVYNFPEAKPVMEPAAGAPKSAQYQPSQALGFPEAQSLSGQESTSKQPSPESSVAIGQASQPPEQQNIAQILENLKLLETNDFPFANVEANDVKNLLGNLYMELLFPHNDKDTFLNAPLTDAPPSFDFKI